jgi:hypothetical protein
MGRRLFLSYAIAIALLATGWKVADASAADQLETLPDTRVARRPSEARETVTTTTVGGEGRDGRPLPRNGVLVAMIRWGATTFGVVDASNRRWTELREKPTGPLFFSRRGNRLAYLVREGVDPANNYIEIQDWHRENHLVVKPAADHAILGFALAPDGKKLAYAAMNIQRSRSTDVNWHVGIADLERHETHVTLTSSLKKIPEEGIPVPFAWSSQTGRVYLQGWLPFRGMIKQSIWAASPDGKQLNKVIPETSYVGIPSLSPDGSRFSYMANDPDSLPRDYVPPPGPPPGNVLLVINLVSGEKMPWARAPQRAFGAHAWSANGEKVLAVERDWLGGRFRDDEIRRIGKASSMSVAKVDQSRSLKQITGLLECADDEVFWVEREQSSSSLYLKAAQKSHAIFDVADGTLQLLGCLNR